MMPEASHIPLVAVVDDDPGLRRVLRRVFEQNQYSVVEGSDGLEAVELARVHAPAAMVLDVRMPRMSGLEALQTIKSQCPRMPIILLTAFIDVRDAVAAIKAGAHDYLEKPVDLDELIVAVDEAIGRARESRLPAPAEEASAPAGFVVESAPMRALLREAARVAPTDVTTLLLGESGTGKEVLARFVHERSTRRDGPFVAVNCAALPESLIESELFGHERGAFTGAVARKAGRFEEASGGTLLLDEIGEMPLPLQPKLLRVLEEQTIRRVGGTQELRVDVRVIAATNRQLEEDAREGRFRSDLLYRLNVVALSIPPLRERREDILPLADHFLESNDMRDKRFAPATQRALLDYGWPGNVRELRNAVMRAAIMARGSVIMPEDLPSHLRLVPPAAKTLPAEASMADIEKSAILNALAETGGNKTQAARMLGISRRTLIYRLRSYGM